jgi:dTDP-glucose 4,6-dehydratase
VKSPALVLGSNSYSGAAFVDHLLAAGTEVIGVSRSEEVALPFRVYAWRRHPGAFTFERLDLNHDLDRLERLMRERRTGTVVNFAAQSMVGESWLNPDHWMMTNVVSTVRLHERLRQMDFLDRYVHVTTPEVYGSVSGWVREDQPFDPSTPYAVSRAAGDMSLRSYFKAYGFPVVYTRAANVYGAGQPLYRILPRTIFFALTGKRLQLHGGGTSQRSFIHGRDVAEATRRIATDGRNGETYHISTTRQVTIRALVEMILAELKLRFEDCVDVVGDRLGKDAAYMLDSRKLRDELGWADTVTLEQGVAESIRWVRDNLDALKRLPADYIHKP